MSKRPQLDMNNYSSSLEELRSDSSLQDCDLWRCTKCKVYYAFKRKGNKRGGPYHRSIDRRIGWFYCWRNCKKRVILIHESVKQSAQPKQDEEALEGFVESIRRRAEESSRATLPTEPNRRVRRVRKEDQG